MSLQDRIKNFENLAKNSRSLSPPDKKFKKYMTTKSKSITSSRLKSSSGSTDSSQSTKYVSVFETHPSNNAFDHQIQGPQSPDVKSYINETNSDLMDCTTSSHLLNSNTHELQKRKLVLSKNLSVKNKESLFLQTLNHSYTGLPEVHEAEYNKKIKISSNNNPSNITKKLLPGS